MARSCSKECSYWGRAETLLNALLRVIRADAQLQGATGVGLLQTAAELFIHYRPTSINGVTLENLRDVCLLQKQATEEQVAWGLEYCRDRHESSLRASCAATRASFRDRIRRDLGEHGKLAHKLTKPSMPVLPIPSQQQEQLVEQTAMWGKVWKGNETDEFNLDAFAKGHT